MLRVMALTASLGGAENRSSSHKNESDNETWLELDAGRSTGRNEEEIRGDGVFCRCEGGP